MNMLIVEFLEPFAWSSLALWLYIVFLRRMADFAFSYRMELAKIGEETLSMDISTDDENILRFMLDNAFSAFPAVLAALLFPFVLIIALFKQSKSENVSKRVADNRKRVLRLFAISSFAANPAFGILLILQLFVVGLLTLLLAGNITFTKACLSLIRVEAKTVAAIFNRGWRHRSA